MIRARHSSQEELDNDNVELVVKEKFTESLRNAQVIDRCYFHILEYITKLLCIDFAII